MHKFMKAAGCKTEEEFYQKYPSEEHFFAAYPHMKGNQTMQNGGAASGHPNAYWNGERWVSTAGDSGTFSDGTYFAMGGPTFMPGGSAPVFAMGGRASFNVSNNEYPTPFAMAPGTGRGTGYLQDLPTHMAFGGQIPGAELVHPFAMNPGTGHGGGMLQDLPVEMKKGGIHIAPSKRGTFTAAATKHGKSVQAFASQVLAHKENYSPAMVKKANFARNAAKWHHEYGGTAMPDNPGFRALPPAVQQKIMDNMQTGGMVTADRMVYMPGGQYMEYGGTMFHPLAKFMQGGGSVTGSYSVGQFVPGLGYWDGTKFIQDPPPPPDPNWHPPMSNPNEPPQAPPPPEDKDNNGDITGDDKMECKDENGNPIKCPETSGTTDANNNSSINTKNNKFANWGNAILGTGMGVLGAANVLSGRRDEMNLRNKQFNDRLSANAFAAMNQPGGHGDYTQKGIFRPENYVPTKPGMFYPQTGPMAMYGGNTYATGGYVPGSVHDVDDAEIARLRKLGYDFEIM